MIQPVSSLKITPNHLERKAIISIRQSSPKQVRLNTESQRNQRALVERAQSVGWCQARIGVLDADLGQAATSKEGRDDFTQLAADVALGHVGIIFGWEVSRLARNNADWYQILDLAEVVGALIADIEGVYDPRSYNDRILLGLYVRSRTPYDAPTPECRPTQQGCSWRVYSTPANRSGANSRWPSGKRPGRTDPAVYRAGLLYLCRTWEWVENAPFSQSTPHPVTSPPNQRTTQRRVALERANGIHDHRDLAQPRLRRSLCLWAASHRSDAAQTRATWLRSGAQADGRVGDSSTGRVSGLH